MADAVLYDYWRSSASYRVRIALNLAGIAYESRVVDLVVGDQRGEDHLARNPQGLVPVLEIDGQRFTQSLAVLRYLDATRGLGLIPGDPVEAAHQEALAQAIAVDLHPVCNLSVARFGTGLSEGALDMQGWMQHFIRPGLLAFEALLARWKQQPYCTGAQPSLADLCLIPQLYNARRWEVDLNGLARCRAVEAACTALPAFQAAYPDAVKPTSD
ncbi:Maleylpyruvate isomerase [Tritonibacter multivorans]|uniref:Maleylpyruvate isomerase n=1 Tax=Tritonibacter multivorans TaxID=928856 RepID=A0A0P1GBV2_9RHOB|nr:maleylacetoacetate isomerase [Tritonibacter multivorans]MDA7421381.1 maleylacetoacetate isomerase [Tritonibacter multivorans]CUH78892.1 Maleylpyruvate isomerase [Tritonibacter multivorans]SFD28018.1 maleylacetoacetate isomerase [Tritonibacter multivorans]